MSELIYNNEERIQELLEFSKGIIEGKDGAELIKKYERAINDITPHNLLKMEDIQIQNNIDIEVIKKNIGKIINVLYKNLNNYNWKKPENDTFLYFLMKENDALSEKLDNIKKILIKKDFSNTREELLNSISELTKIENHYVKKENILFPYLEKKLDKYRALNVMWSLHDDVRNKLKLVITILKEQNFNEFDFKKEIGELFFLMYGLIQKENLIVYPVASEIISDKEWESMHIQSFEYEFAFIKRPKKPDFIQKIIRDDDINKEYIFKTETGEMNLEQLLLLFENLPIDITFVDENNKVKFFSKPKERFFPRSAAIIGRDVKNCHPPESVHIVEKIVEEFRNGEKDKAQFWLNLKGKFILIQYFALRNEKGEYKGVLEASQDVTEIRSLEGEKILLNWEK